MFLSPLPPNFIDAMQKGINNGHHTGFGVMLGTTNVHRGSLCSLNKHRIGNMRLNGETHMGLLLWITPAQTH